MIKYIGWILALLVPLAAYMGVRSLPHPGSLLVVVAAISAFIGYLLYEHVKHHDHIDNKTIIEQLALGVFIMVILGTIL